MLTFFFAEFEKPLKHRSVHTSQILRTKHTADTAILNPTEKEINRFF
jgi:hypothetical protein